MFLFVYFLIFDFWRHEALSGEWMDSFENFITAFFIFCILSLPCVTSNFFILLANKSKHKGTQKSENLHFIVLKSNLVHHFRHWVNCLVFQVFTTLSQVIPNYPLFPNVIFHHSWDFQVKFFITLWWVHSDEIFETAPFPEIKNGQKRPF